MEFIDARFQNPEDGSWNKIHKISINGIRRINPIIKEDNHSCMSHRKDFVEIWHENGKYYYEGTYDQFMNVIECNNLKHLKLITEMLKVIGQTQHDIYDKLDPAINKKQTKIKTKPKFGIK